MIQTSRAALCRVLREVGAGIADGRIRYREDIVDHLEKASATSIGMLDGLNFGKVIVRVAAGGEIEIKEQAGDVQAAVTRTRPALRDRGFRRITISTSRSSAVRKFISRSTENPSS